MALTVSVLVDLGMCFIYWPTGFSSDYGVFWTAVRTNPYFVACNVPFAYPPTALIWLSPLRVIPFWPGYILWTALSLAAFVAAARRLWGGPAVALALISPSLWLGVLPGQTTLFVAGLIFLAYSTERKGLFLGLALTVKPQLVFLAPVFLLADRDYRALAEMALVVVAMCALATLTLGFPIWADWLGSIQKLHTAVDRYLIFKGALSPAAAYQISPVPFMIAGIVLAFVAGRYFDEPRDRLCAMVSLSLFAAPYSMRYELAVFAPAMAALILSGGWRGAVAIIPFADLLGPPSLLLTGTLRKSQSV